MSISRPKELYRFLTEHQLQAKKTSSQNFLIDGNILRKIVKEADLSEKDLAIEIGPGPGALTETLLQTGCKVWAIERDRKLATLLQRLCEDTNKLHIHCCDFLQFPLEEALQKEGSTSSHVKVVANLPYHITTPILAKLLPLTNHLSDLIVMVQKEVALRLTAQKGTKDYSSFTLFVQFFSEVSYCFTVKPSCFYPRPSVESAIVHFRLRPPPPVKNPSLLFTVIHAAFQKRRKMMRASLKELAPSSFVEETLKQMGLSPLSRPEELSLQQFIFLTDQLFVLPQAKFSSTRLPSDRPE